MSARLAAALAFVLRWEGGYVNHPADPGGATNKGVTQRTFFRHFPTKEAVLFADYETHFEWFAEALERRPADEPLFDAVLAAMAAVPRHVFVEEALSYRAYEDTALPLGLGQTISQPYIVARMIEVLKAGRAERLKSTSARNLPTSICSSRKWAVWPWPWR